MAIIFALFFMAIPVLLIMGISGTYAMNGKTLMQVVFGLSVGSIPIMIVAGMA